DLIGFYFIFYFFCRFMGVCVHEGQLHALTEYINGGSLEQLIQNRSLDLPHATRMKLALDIARGMEYLHSRGVFHRDLTSKNVLIKKNEETGEMTAVVGDFGLAAKIPDPLGGYRLPTVGSPYWMSPECLKGQWYDEKSDVFSYGIVLCEMIARVEADPDVLPRTENFGLDYLAFSEMCGPCPPDFLKLAFSCCTFEPKSRPSFSEIVSRLEEIVSDYHKNDKTNKVSCNLGARSEEIIPTSAAEAEALIENRETAQLKKSNHRRSLSEDVGCVVFPPHTAPSDKARCHLMLPRQASVLDTQLLTPKHVGESMVKQDPHYKPMSTSDRSRTNPFATLSQFRGVKKILGDLFSSCFELPSPFYGPTPPSTPTGEPAADASSTETSATLSAKSDTPSLEEKPLSLPASPTLMRRRILTNSGLVPPPPLLAPNFSSPLPSSEDNPEDGKIPKKSVLKCCEEPSRRSSSRRCKATEQCQKGAEGLFFKFKSSRPRRRGSCESGFFSSVGEDFGSRSHHTASSATLSSSSAASSLFLLDDSAVSTTTVSSLRSGSGDAPHHSLLFAAKRSSSIYTDSSEDISSLGGGDLSYWDDRNFSGIGQPQQISKIVEYFERKQNFARRMEGASLNDAMRSSKIALLRKSLEKSQMLGPSQTQVGATQPEKKRNLNATQRLMICEGAVRSKLPLIKELRQESEIHASLEVG
ncbi:hypothetical protein L9F63_001790, partial [Diploptera punctata]